MFGTCSTEIARLNLASTTQILFQCCICLRRLAMCPWSVYVPDCFMLKIGKTAQQAIAAASYLAEHYDDNAARISSSEIAEARELPQPVVAKILAQLSQHGLTTGTTGPSGGYRLARAPDDISLHSIISIFERTDVRPMCPFGPNWCGKGHNCPLHEAFGDVAAQVDTFFNTHTLGPFRQKKHCASVAKKVSSRNQK